MSDRIRNPPIGCASAGYASAKSARAALAQSTSFCTVGAPLTPIAPTISPSTLMGNPPPYAAIRGSAGMPAKSDGSLWIKLKNSCVETPNRAVYALFWAISMERIGAPSIRLKALRLPPSSRIATFSVTPISLAFATAASTIFCASSEEILFFFPPLAIGLLPPLEMYCALNNRFPCAIPADEPRTGIAFSRTIRPHRLAEKQPAVPNTSDLASEMVNGALVHMRAPQFGGVLVEHWD